MIGIYNRNWEHIPVLEVVHSDKKDQALPVLTYYHGFTSAKEHNLPLAYLLAEKGYRVVLPDCYLHGERQGDITNDKRELEFFAIVEQNIKEIALIKKYLEDNNLLKDGRFGLAGTSMGGITTAAALTQYPWIKATAILMGSPKITDYAKGLIEHTKRITEHFPISEEEIEHLYQSLEKVDLSRQIEKLYERPIFFWHGEKDSVVPFDHAYNFYERAIQEYKNPESIRFLREPGRDHKVSRYAILETVKWFTMQL
ncbi:prolyl oligopeptidase family serine peptidase [Aquibacillus sp. 3ASR75-11]|uniref:Prolyl oligopeptidase family serine peptidase n=1 Tax=Terrihalobacillus insolitus TaxID=2950438 RepID=A0A9X3WU16_9BACI|nr:prolyl oligopeptidase family serine peptidase [Terrihalobacillus insolitus]MDC3413706.1 prolyl oligopeptidase family serine peptidase [Terrihalobacillus insolitus]MDC3425565.1 prolyl oligopeptidase family serine peptidase [Terrihalobacillus insolitus]